MVLPGATDILPDAPLPAGMLSTPPAQIRKYLPPQKKAASNSCWTAFISYRSNCIKRIIFSARRMTSSFGSKGTA